MKTLFAIIALIFLSVIGALAQPSPSLSETLQWLHSFTAAHGVIRVGQSFAGNDLTFRGCQATDMFTNDMKPNGSGITFSLRDLDPSMIQASGWTGTTGTVEFRTTNDIPAIYWVDFGRKGDALGDFWAINFDDVPGAERFSKALKHAVILCGGQSSTF